MENRNFHTALLGGFRKKDVVAFLAEDKRQQEAALQDLNGQLEEAAEQIRQLMEQRDAAQELLLSRQEQKTQLEEELAQAQEALDCARQENVRLEAELQQQNSRNGDLQAQLAQLQQQLDTRPEVDLEELQLLREELAAARLRAEELDARLRQQPQTKGSSQSMDQLWHLCGKMERTLGQMERMLDGPYRMTCYPEPVEEWEEPVLPAEEPLAEEEIPAPAAEPPSVKSLLQRIRRKS